MRTNSFNSFSEAMKTILNTQSYKICFEISVGFTMSHDELAIGIIVIGNMY